MDKRAHGAPTLSELEASAANARSVELFHRRSRQMQLSEFGTVSRDVTPRIVGPEHDALVLPAIVDERRQLQPQTAQSA